MFIIQVLATRLKLGISKSKKATKPQTGLQLPKMWIVLSRLLKIPQTQLIIYWQTLLMITSSLLLKNKIQRKNGILLLGRNRL